MISCEQAPGVNMLQHGEQVAARYADLHSLLTTLIPPKFEWHLPFKQSDILCKLAKLALTPEQARTYHVMHDCGKPFCLEVGEDGKRRFPNHAAMSEQAFKQIYPDDLLSARLIGKDMLCHLTKSAGIEVLVNDEDFPTLLLTAWAEVHTNAAMFGGTSSDSFKIKASRLEKLTRSATLKF
jgi:hypothetical protein